MVSDMSCVETIAALSSASGSSELAIIRISGPRAVEILGSLSPGANLEQAPGFRASQAVLELPAGISVPCEIYIFRAPHSYTTEDVAEIHMPGSPLFVEKVLLALAAAGARPAGPGEFTRRAYLGGRIDLAQAEAVSDIVNARGAGELAAAQRVLKGSLSEMLSAAAGQLKDLLALMEASIDFGDQDIEPFPADAVSTRVRGVLERLQSAARAAPEPGRDVPRVLICGAANVGKSSLFNRLLERERAIISPDPGTTRDLVSAALKLGDTNVLLLDSAGRREPEGEIEELAFSALEESLAQADIAIFVVEAHRPPSDSEIEFYGRITCPRLLVANKCDLATGPGPETCGLDWDGQASSLKPHACSCLTGQGIEDVRRALTDMVFGEVERVPDALALSVRQRDALSRARAALERALCAQAMSGEELIAEDLREALCALGEITGETPAQEILDRVFDRFCIGK